MFDKNERNINISGTVSQSNVNVADNVTQTQYNTINQQANNETPIEIINQIQDLINRTEALEAAQKQSLASNVDMMRKAFIEGKNPAVFIPAIQAIAQDCSSTDFQSAMLSKMSLLEGVTQN